MEQSPKSKTQQFFVNYKSLILLVAGTLLASGSGAVFQWANYQYDHNDRHKHEMEQMSYELFNSLSFDMGKRLYQMRRCIWALKYKLDPKIFDQRYKLYQETLKDWNYQLQRNQACVKHCFGDEMLNTFVLEIQADFGTLNSLIKGGKDLTRAEELANELYGKIDTFNFEMMEQTWKSDHKDEH